MKGHKADELYEESRKLLANQRFKEAIPQLLRLREYPSYRVRALTNLGFALFYMAHYRAANRFLEKAIDLDPGFQPAYLNRANTLLKMKRYENAELHFLRAMELRQLCAHSKSGYLQVLLESGRLHEAECSVNKWLAQEPANSFYLQQYGLMLARMARHQEAISAFAAAFEQDSTQHSYLYSMASSMISINQFEDAASSLLEAIRLSPATANYHALLGYAYWSQSLLEPAKDAFSTAEKLEPESMAYFLNTRLCLPLVPESIQQIEACRANFKVVLNEALKDKTRRFRPEDLWIPHVYNLAYHNQDDRDILELYACLYSQQVSRLVSCSKESHKDITFLSYSGSRRRVKIGFASGFFYEHSNAYAFEGLIQELDRRLFEVVIIHGAGAKRDYVHDRMNAACDHVVYLPDLENGLIPTLQGLKLDILFLTDIGMSDVSMQLAAVRTASIQITGWGTPLTSGFPTIDYYISSELVEPTEADRFYSETLVRLPSLPCCYPATSLSCVSRSRQYFGLPQEIPLLGCLQQLHKIHPDFDFVLERIALQNPSAKFIIIENHVGRVTTAYLNRLLGHSPALREKLILLPPISRDNFIALSGCIDMLLDPMHYGSGVTFFETSYFGTPIVTLEGKYLRSRLVAAGYRMMGIQGAPIAASIEEYVRIITALVQDPLSLQALRTEIAAKAKSDLYDNLDYVRGFERFCLGLMGQA